MAAGAKRRATVTRCESTDDTRSNKFVFSRILLPRPLHTPCSCSRGVCAAKRVPMTRPVQRPTGAAPLAYKDQMHTQAPCKNGMRPPRASLRVQVFNAGRRLNVYRMQPARGAGGSYLGAGMQRTQRRENMAGTLLDDVFVLSARLCRSALSSYNNTPSTSETGGEEHTTASMRIRFFTQTPLQRSSPSPCRAVVSRIDLGRCTVGL